MKDELKSTEKARVNAIKEKDQIKADLERLMFKVADD